MKKRFASYRRRRVSQPVLRNRLAPLCVRRLAIESLEQRTLLDAGGMLAYVPEAGFSGIDTSTYEANDGLADSNVAMVTLDENAAPVAVDDFYSIDEDGTLESDQDSVAGINLIQWTENDHFYGLVQGSVTWLAAEAAVETLAFRGASRTFGYHCQRRRKHLCLSRRYSHHPVCAHRPDRCGLGRELPVGHR